MDNFILHIVVSVVLGFLLLILARDYKKPLIKYFFLGFSISFGIRIVYFLIYGSIHSFEITENFSQHQNFAVGLSLVVVYIVYRIIKKRFKKEKKLKANQIDEIGKTES